MKMITPGVCLALVVLSGCGEDLVPPLSQAAVPNGSRSAEDSREAEAVRSLQEQAVRGLNESLKANEKAIQDVETDIKEVRGDVAENRKDIDDIQSTLDEMEVQSAPGAPPAAVADAILQRLAQQAAEVPVAVQPDTAEAKPHEDTCMDLQVKNAALERDVFWQTVIAGQARVENYRLQRELRESQWRERAASTRIYDPQWSGRTFAGHYW